MMTICCPECAGEIKTNKRTGVIVCKSCKTRIPLESYFGDGMKAVLQNIEMMTWREMDLTEEEYNGLLQMQQDKTEVVVTCVDACVVDKPGDFANNYHDVTFPDGNEFCAMSGHHLRKV